MENIFNSITKKQKNKLLQLLELMEETPVEEFLETMEETLFDWLDTNHADYSQKRRNVIKCYLHLKNILCCTNKIYSKKHSVTK